MKMDQIAYYCQALPAETAIKKFLGLQDAEWISDLVTAESTFPNSKTPMKSRAVLQFNYDLGIELEILRYLEGPSWHDKNDFFHRHIPFLSHIGIHLDDDEPFPNASNFKLVQETITLKHTSKYLTDPESPGYGRTYHYQIYKVSPGSYIKYIKRIAPWQ